MMTIIRFGDPDAEFSGKIENLEFDLYFTNGTGIYQTCPKKNDKEEIQDFINRVNAELEPKRFK